MFDSFDSPAEETPPFSKEVRNDLEIIEEYLNGVPLPPLVSSASFELLESAPPVIADDLFGEGVETESFASVEVSPADEVPQITTSTMAEIYVSQGFIQRAIDIYAELLAESPGNPALVKRIDQLVAQLEAEEQAAESPAILSSTGSVSPSGASQSATDAKVVAKLEQWLETIRRRR